MTDDKLRAALDEAFDAEKATNQGNPWSDIHSRAFVISRVTAALAASATEGPHICDACGILYGRPAAPALDVERVRQLEKLAAALVNDHRGIPYDVIAEIDRIAALRSESGEGTE